MDQSLFAAPHGLSQRITSFIACACQGIHQMPLIHLIVLIANAHNLCSFGSFRRTNLIRLTRLPFTTEPLNDAIDVFDTRILLEPRRAVRLHQILRPASRDKIRWCAVRQHQSNMLVRGFFRRQKSRRPEGLQVLVGRTANNQHVLRTDFLPCPIPKLFPVG